MRYIYALVDPRDNTVRYVGQTDDMKRRYSEHTNRIESTTKGAWIQELRALNLKPSLVQLDTCDDQAQANYLESWWIILGRRQGWDLVNGTNPGEWRVADDFRALFADELMRMYQEHKTACERLSTEVIALAVERERAKWYGRVQTAFHGLIALFVIIGFAFFVVCAWQGRTAHGLLDDQGVYLHWALALAWAMMLVIIYIHRRFVAGFPRPTESYEFWNWLQLKVGFTGLWVSLTVFGWYSLVDLIKMFA